MTTIHCSADIISKITLIYIRAIEEDCSHPIFEKKTKPFFL